MTEPVFLDTAQGRRIAYHLTEGQGPCIVFLGGLKSDMGGTKAVILEQWAKSQGRAYLRLDYSGHGDSSGTFEDGSIGEWAQDAFAAVDTLTSGPLVVVGSSMGGWQALLLARRIPDRIAGLVTIAAAPDFTETGYWANFTEAQKQALNADGQVELQSDYMDPYIVTKKLIEDGRRNQVLIDPLILPFPMRCLQGTADTAVSTQTALGLMDHAQCSDMQLTLVKDADHRFSDPTCLGLIQAAILDVTSQSAVLTDA